MAIDLSAHVAAVPPADVRAALDRVLRSAPFAHSPQLQRFLRFLVERALAGDAARLKEYVIALEVFARPASFDPRIDSLVRVEARRLRSALAAYYGDEGRRDPVVIELHKGRYLPEFRRAVVPPSGGRRVRVVFLAGIAVAGLGAGALWLLLHTTPAGALTERDTVVLAGFVNSTGEPIFDQALQQGLASGLEQTPFLNLVSERRVDQLLRLMGRKPSDPLDGAGRRDLCLRAGAKALITGSIARIGSQYVVGLTASDCATGDDFAHVQEKAARKEDVLRALEAGARKMRSRLGESLASIARFGVGIEDATTASLEALQVYSLGRATTRERGSPADIPFYKRAIEIDPEFAAAHAALGVSYVNQGQATLAREHLERAFQLRDRVSEREKYRVSAYYYQAVTGQLDKATEIYEVWTRVYPREFAPQANLALASVWLGDYARALTAAKDAQALEPGNVLGYTNLAAVLIKLGRPDDARVVLDQATARGLSSRFLRLNLCYLAFLRGDSTLLPRQLEEVRNNPGDEAALLSLAADTEAYLGRLEQARLLTARAADAAVRAGERESAAAWLLDGALREAEFDERSAAAGLVARALALSSGRDAITLAALAKARAGDVEGASGLADRLEAEYSSNTVIGKYWLPTIRAAIHIGRGEATEALAVLDQAASCELGSPPPFGPATMYPVYLRGVAELRLRRAAAAATEFQRLLDRPGLVLNSPLHALSRVQLARAHRLAGDLAASRQAFDGLQALWKDADPDLPPWRLARREAGSLH